MWEAVSRRLQYKGEDSGSEVMPGMLQHMKDQKQAWS